MSDLALTTGALTTNGTVRTGAGKLAYVEAGAGAVALYEGSTSGNLISAIPSSTFRSFQTPVKYGDGLYITVASGSAVVHTA